MNIRAVARHPANAFLGELVLAAADLTASIFALLDMVSLRACFVTERFPLKYIINEAAATNYTRFRRELSMRATSLLIVNL